MINLCKYLGPVDACDFTTNNNNEDFLCAYFMPGTALSVLLAFVLWNTCKSYSEFYYYHHYIYERTETEKDFQDHAERGFES